MQIGPWPHRVSCVLCALQDTQDKAQASGIVLAGSLSNNSSEQQMQRGKPSAYGRVGSHLGSPARATPRSSECQLVFRRSHRDLLRPLPPARTGSGCRWLLLTQPRNSCDTSDLGLPHMGKTRNGDESGSISGDWYSVFGPPTQCGQLFSLTT